MLTIGPFIEMDQHSLSLWRDGKHVGYIQWHEGRLRFQAVTDTHFAEFSFAEMQQIMAKMNEIDSGGRKPYG